MRNVLALVTCVVCVGCSSRSMEDVVWIPPPSPAVAGDGAAAGAPNARTEPSVEPIERKELITVNDAVREALEYNRTVRTADKGTEIAGTFEKERVADMMPNVGIHGGLTRRDRPPIAIFSGMPVQTGPRDVATFNATLTAPLFAFGRYINSLKAARLSRQQSEAERDTAESDVAAAVTAAAFAYLASKRAVGVALSNEEALLQQVNDAQAQLEAERVTRSAVLEAEVEWEAAKRERERFESLIKIQRMTLNQLLGRGANAKTDVVDDPNTQAPRWKLAALEEEALRQRAELRAARLEVEAAMRTLKAVTGGEWGELRGFVDWSTTDNSFVVFTDVTTVGLQLDVPLITGGGRGARIRRAELDVDIARLRMQDLVEQITTDVATSHREVQETYKDIAVAKRSIARTEESLRIQREKFAVGRATNREVLETTSLLSDARFAYVQALYSYNIALRELHRARGADPHAAPLPREAKKPQPAKAE